MHNAWGNRAVLYCHAICKCESLLQLAWCVKRLKRYFLWLGVGVSKNGEIFHPPLLIFRRCNGAPGPMNDPCIPLISRSSGNVLKDGVTKSFHALPRPVTEVSGHEGSCPSNRLQLTCRLCFVRSYVGVVLSYHWSIALPYLYTTSFCTKVEIFECHPPIGTTAVGGWVPQIAAANLTYCLMVIHCRGAWGALERVLFF